MSAEEKRLKEELVWAMRRLSRSLMTEAELRRALVRRGLPEDGIELVVARLREDGFLDDARYAEAYARIRLERGYGTARIHRELLKRGIDEDLSENALSALRTDFEEAEVLRAALAKRLRARGEPQTRKDLKNLSNFLVRRGFPPYMIREELEEFFDHILGNGG